MSFPSPTANQLRPTALVVEDSLIHQRLATSLLQRRGFFVTVVDNGREAVIASRDFVFDLILMDVEMPILDGFAATRQIRCEEINTSRHVPIVAVTSLDDRERVVSAGMDDYIAKPISAAALDGILPGLLAQSACC